MFRIYKYVRYKKTNGDVITDDCLLDIVETNIGVVDRIDVDLRQYKEKSRFIKEWYDCDYHVEVMNQNGKWKFQHSIESIIDNERRSITTNYPVEYLLDKQEDTKDN